MNDLKKIFADLNKGGIKMTKSDLAKEVMKSNLSEDVKVELMKVLFEQKEPQPANVGTIQYPILPRTQPWVGTEITW